MRIAQITDLHLRHHLPGSADIPRRRSRAMAWMFPRALEEARAAGADLVAVTGDLLDVPSWLSHPEPGFETDDPPSWRAAATADYRWVKACLDGCGMPYLVLPGNHDHEELFASVLDLSERRRDIAGHRVIRFTDREHAGHVPRRFAGERSAWEAALRDTASPPQVHLQHYVITPSLRRGYPHSYGEGEELTRRMVDSGRVRLALSGHYHAGTELIRYGGTTFATGPAFCEPPHPWRLYDVDASGVEMEPRTLGDGAAARPAVFVDRDGTLGEEPSFYGGPERFRLLPGVADAIRRLREAGYAVVVVTNQAAVGMGYVPASAPVLVHDKLARLLAEEGTEVDAVYFSTAAGSRAIFPEHAGQQDAKPSPAMLHRAATELGLDLRRSWMIGDRLDDVRTGWNGGVTPILVRTGYGAAAAEAVRAESPDALVVDDLAAAAERVRRKR